MKNSKNEIKRMFGGSIILEKSEDDGSPVYFQLAKAIQHQIEKGSLTAGELVPSERKVAEAYNISIATVRKAFEELIRRDHIHRVQGKGTYVSGTEDRRKQIRYYPFVKGFHAENEASDIKFIELKIIKGTALINAHLKIQKTEKLYLLKRIMTQAQLPMIYCISYFPEKMFRGLETYSRNDFENLDLYVFLEKRFKISTVKHIELFDVGLADQEIATQLRVNKGHPLLRIEKLILTHKERPYEYRISHCITKEFKMRRII
jgi:GntR family transcriptional regulator